MVNKLRYNFRNCTEFGGEKKKKKEKMEKINTKLKCKPCCYSVNLDE